jgi:hypothetical protein
MGLCMRGEGCGRADNPRPFAFGKREAKGQGKNKLPALNAARNTEHEAIIYVRTMFRFALADMDDGRYAYLQ